MGNDWKTEEFTAAEIKANMDSRKFDVPKYQRGLVWSHKQKMDLVDTIKKGLPFGTLLLYQKSDGTYQIIDGLQRSSALIMFVDNPALFFDEDDIDPDIIKRIAGLINVGGNQSIIEEKVVSTLIDWVKKDHPTMTDVENMQFVQFGVYLSKEFPTILPHILDVATEIEPMMNEYKSICKKISNTRVPAIVVTGDPALLPILFERINSRGTHLTKYQIYAATWTEKFIIDDDELQAIVKANKDRYDTMLDNIGVLDDYDPADFLSKNELDAFEIAYGFGKLLTDRWPHLFTKSSESNHIDSIGFNLINTCLGIKNKDAKIMNTVLDDKVGDKVCVFLKCILDAVKIVDNQLGKYSKFKSNSRSGERPLHTELQIVSIISSVFLCKYANITYSGNTINIEYHFDSINSQWSRTQKKAFKKNASKTYIMDVLLQKWGNAGDSRLDQILLTPDHYCQDVSKNEFESTLVSWNSQLNADRQEFTRVTNPKEPELLMLAVVYLSIFTAEQQADNSKYDIEHLATKKLMKKRLEKFDGNLKLPLSAFGNLCLLPEYENRSKGEKTLYDDKDYLNKSNLTITEIEERYSFTTADSLQWTSDTKQTEQELKESYMNFIDERFSIMKTYIMEKYDQI